MKQTNSPKMSRRRFLDQTITTAAFSIVPAQVMTGASRTVPSEKITLACIGTGGQGLINLYNFLQFEEIQVVAVCDVNRESGGYISWNWGQGKEQKTAGREPARRMADEHYAQKQGKASYQGCSVYSDYRQLLAREDVDAVVVSTPDHTHAVITMAALRHGKHVYCEKPLTWSVREARLIAEEAKRAGVATQLGNQGQASEQDRMVREIIGSGAIGNVREVHVSINARFWHWPAMLGRPKEAAPVPQGLDWDLWLGPAPTRPYHPEYHPWTWRNWWDFGTGQLGDLGCHKLSTVFKALDLKHPVSVEASSTKRFPDVYPLGVLARYEFPERGDKPALTLNWYDGGLKPPFPKDLEPGRRLSDTLYVGDKASLMGHLIIPEPKRKAIGRVPKTLASSPGHYHEWVQACRGGPAAGANFVDHAGNLTETCLLGNVALRAGRKIQWDGPSLTVTNHAKANDYLHREYREGWTL